MEGPSILWDKANSTSFVESPAIARTSNAIQTLTGDLPASCASLTHQVAVPVVLCKENSEACPHPLNPAKLPRNASFDSCGAAFHDTHEICVPVASELTGNPAALYFVPPCDKETYHNA